MHIENIILIRNTYREARRQITVIHCNAFVKTRKEMDTQMISFTNLVLMVNRFQYVKVILMTSTMQVS
jgi:hypothetical protein